MISLTLQGDSGGPLYCSPGSGDNDYPEYGGFETKSSGNNFLCGVVSFGLGPCGGDGKFKPVYTNVINYVKWIEEQICK